MGVGAGLYMYVVVVQKFTFAISSPDEFLYDCSCTVHLRLSCKVVTGRVARRDIARGTVARLVFGIESCSILCDFDARQSRASATRDKIAGVTSALWYFNCVEVISQGQGRVEVCVVLILVKKFVAFLNLWVSNAIRLR